MATLPTNFIPRREIQRLVARLAGLHHESKHHPVICSVLHELLTRLGTLDSLLDDVAGEHEKSLRHQHIFETEGCSHEWREARHCIHTGRGLFFLAIAQQVMIVPGLNNFQLGISRYRMILGDPGARPLYST